MTGWKQAAYLPPVKGRSCGTCTLCCYLPGVVELNKPRNTWCQHCEQGKGCKIYAERPESCRAWSCGWLIWEDIPEFMYPLHSKIMIQSPTPENKVYGFFVDPDYPDRWREEPYYSFICKFAAAGLRERLYGTKVVVADKTYEAHL